MIYECIYLFFVTGWFWRKCMAQKLKTHTVTHTHSVTHTHTIYLIHKTYKTWSRMVHAENFRELSFLKMYRQLRQAIFHELASLGIPKGIPFAGGFQCELLTALKRCIQTDFAADLFRTIFQNHPVKSVNQWNIAFAKSATQWKTQTPASRGPRRDFSRSRELLDQWMMELEPKFPGNIGSCFTPRTHENSSYSKIHSGRYIISGAFLKWGYPYHFNRIFHEINQPFQGHPPWLRKTLLP